MLRPEQREKLDPTQDELFYSFPRFVNHIDDNFINTLKELYRERLKPDIRILDLMSSWVSHLPEEIEFDHVEGHGMNEEELRKNLRLDHYIVQNLNTHPKLPFEDQSFDAVLNAVSVQYLQYPEGVFSEIYRVLKPNGVAIVSFSNRMFYEKAIAAWREGSPVSRVQLVKHYFQSVPGFSEPEVIIYESNFSAILQMFGLAGFDPFYAVIAERLG